MKELLESVALIFGIIGPVIGVSKFITKTVNKVQEKQRKPAKSANQQQLEDILAPLDKILFYDSTLSNVESVGELRSIVNENHVHIAPQLLEALEPLLTNATISDEDIFHAKTVVSSFYNWARKAQKYPFDSNKIKFEYTPIAERYKYTQRAYIWLSVYVCGLCAFYLAVIVLNATIEFATFNAQIPLTIIGMGVFWLVSKGVHNARLFVEHHLKLFVEKHNTGR